MIGRAFSSVVLFALACAACSGQPDDNESSNTEQSAGMLPRFDVTVVEAMKKELRGEPKIKDLLFQIDDPVEWQIGVFDDGSSQLGYAAYICLKLRERGLYDDETDVRIVDIVKVNRGIGFRDASLAHISCKDEENLGA